MINEIPHSVNRKFVLITIFFSSFLTAFSTYTTVISARIIEIELGMDVVTIVWASTIFILAAAMFQIPFGKVADLFGRKKIFLSGIVLFTLSSILLAFVDTSITFIVFRFMQGLGAALIYATSNAILTASYPPNQRGKVIGISVTGVYIGLTLSPLLGGIMTQNLGWRSQFWFNIPFGALIILLVLFKVKGEWTSEKREKIDYLGSIIYALFLFFLIFAFSLLPSIQGYIFILVSILGAVVFFFWEKRIKNPVLNFDLFKNNRYFSFSCLVSIFFYISTIALALLLSLFMQYLKGMSPQEAGFILLVQPLIQAIFSPIAGRLSDRIETKTLVSMGVLLVIIGIIPLIFLESNYPIYLIAISFGIIGLGTAFFSSPNIRAIMSSVPKSSLGIAAGLEGTMRTIGQTLSFGVLTIVFAVIIGDVIITPVYYPQFITSAQVICITFLIISFLSLIFSILRGKQTSMD
ncbi:MAG: MFS transporter [Candidatus Lokiarchaeota archaeon]|nr:MFS transporter [Candidatus Lokiarchaeota archaeon]